MRRCIVLLLAIGCSSETINFGEGTGDGGGEAGAASGGAAGAAGSGGLGGEDGAVVDAGVDADTGPCGPLMLLSGSVCVDKQPALHADGSQGAAVSWVEAVTICEGRGARLCTEAEREGACPNGQYSLDPTAKEMYCSGPANTWEWSSSTLCSDGRCKSPCCNSLTNPCQCSIPLTESLGFRCCKNL
jgi:hypothetical protein